MPNAKAPGVRRQCNPFAAGRGDLLRIAPPEVRAVPTSAGTLAAVCHRATAVAAVQELEPDGRSSVSSGAALPITPQGNRENEPARRPDAPPRYKFTRGFQGIGVRRTPRIPCAPGPPATLCGKTSSTSLALTHRTSGRRLRSGCRNPMGGRSALAIGDQAIQGLRARGNKITLDLE